jgi:hypothetical protein
LKEAADDIERTRQELIREHGLGRTDEKGTRIPESPEKLNAFYQAFQVVLNAESDVQISMLKTKDLRLECNNIPVTVLATLSWIFDEESPESVRG